MKVVRAYHHHDGSVGVIVGGKNPSTLGLVRGKAASKRSTFRMHTGAEIGFKFGKDWVWARRTVLATSTRTGSRKISARAARRRNPIKAGKAELIESFP